MTTKDDDSERDVTLARIERQMDILRSLGPGASLAKSKLVEWTRRTRADVRRVAAATLTAIEPRRDSGSLETNQ